MSADQETSGGKKKKKLTMRTNGNVVMPEKGHLWRVLDSVDIPTINLKEDSSPIKVMTFLTDIEAYLTHDKEVRSMILSKACRGPDEKEWCRTLDYDFDAIKQKFLEQARRSPEWAELYCKMIKSERFSPDLDEHIKLFRQVAQYNDRDLEDAMVKDLFIRSLGENIFPMSDLYEDGKPGKYRSFDYIVSVAKLNKTAIDRKYKKRTTAPKESAETVAAVGGFKRARKYSSDDYDEDESDGTTYIRKLRKSKKGTHRYEDFHSRSDEEDEKGQKKLCFLCSEPGHTCRNCPKLEEAKKLIQLMDQVEKQRLR